VARRSLMRATPRDAATGETTMFHIRIPEHGAYSHSTSGRAGSSMPRRPTVRVVGARGPGKKDRNEALRVLAPSASAAGGGLRGREALERS